MRWLEMEGCSVDLETGAVTGDRTGKLTNRELALLRFLAHRPEQVVGRDTLLREVFGYAPTAVSRAVDKAMDSLRGKVERDKTHPAHLLTVHGMGYRFLPKAAPPPQVQPPAAAPGPTQPFVGRGSELERLRAMDGPGLVTVLGPGGAGKTRLVREALSGDGRLAFCDLTPCRSADDLVGEVERLLGVVAKEGDLGVRSAVLAARLEMAQTRLVLDNAEHALEAFRPMVDTWRKRASVVVTSRVRLDLSDESVFEVGPLPLEEAIALFRERAGAIEADPADLAAVVELVDRLPLAIELAARRTRLLSVVELRRRLAQTHALLSTTAAEVPERHRDVGRTVAWSWELLDAVQQDALSQLTIFAGGFDLEAAEAVLRLPEGAPLVVDILEDLLDASLLRRAEGGRLDLYEVVRSFARSKLKDPDGVSRRHGAFFGARGMALREALRFDAQPLEPLERDLANLRAVYAPGSRAERADRLAARLAVQGWLRIRGAVPDRQRLLDEALAESEGLVDPVRVVALDARALMDAYRSLEPDPALFSEGEALAIRCQRPDLLARLLGTRATADRMRGRYDEAEATLARAAAIQHQDAWVRVNLQFEEAAVRIDRMGVHDDAGFTEAVEAAQAHGLLWIEAMGRLNLGQLALGKGRRVEARRQLLRARELGLGLASSRIEGMAEQLLAVTARRDQQWDEARTRAERARALGRDQDERFVVGQAELELSLVALHEGRDAEAEAHAAAGLATRHGVYPGMGLLVLAQAVALARLDRVAEARAVLGQLDAPTNLPFRELVDRARPFVAALLAVRAGERIDLPERLFPNQDAGDVGFFERMAREEILRERPSRRPRVVDGD